MGIGALSAASAPSRKHKFVVRTCDAGHIPHNFNTLWCDARDMRAEFGFTHFGLHHSDISVTTPYFLDVLAEEMDRVDADIISCAIAIGDDRGLTSTGVLIPGTWNGRRFTLTEIHDLPETFSIEDTPWPGCSLMLNTGLMLCRFSKPWADEFSGFTLPTRIITAEGKEHAAQFPEDWGMSKWFNDQGLRVFATRKVKVNHIKPKAYGNGLPWGEWTEDLDAVEIPQELQHAEHSLGCAGHRLCD